MGLHAVKFFLGDLQDGAVLESVGELEFRVATDKLSAFEAVCHKGHIPLPGSGHTVVIQEQAPTPVIEAYRCGGLVLGFLQGKKVLFVLPEKNDIVYRSARNIAGVKTTLASTLNVYDILNCDTVVVLKDAVNKIEEVYA